MNPQSSAWTYVKERFHILLLYYTPIFFFLSALALCVSLCDINCRKAVE